MGWPKGKKRKNRDMSREYDNHDQHLEIMVDNERRMRDDKTKKDPQFDEEEMVLVIKGIVNGVLKITRINLDTFVLSPSDE